MPLTVAQLRKEGLLEALASAFDSETKAQMLLDDVGFPAARRPSFADTDNPLGFWRHVATEIAKGVIPGSLEALLSAAASHYPHHSQLRRWAAASGNPMSTVRPSPFIAGPMIRRDEDLLGRAEECKRLDNAIVEGYAVQIIGEKHMGKSSLLSWAERRARWRQRRPVAAIYAGIIQSPEEFVLEVAEGLDRRLNAERQLRNSPPHLVMRSLLPVFLLVDDASALAEPELRLDEVFLGTLRRFCQERKLAWISAASQDLELLINKAGLTSNFLNDSIRILIGQLGATASRHLVARLGHSNAERRAVEDAGGFAYGLQLFCDEVWHCPAGIDLEVVSDKCANRMRSDFRAWWEAQSEDERKLLRRSVAGIARKGMKTKDRQRAVDLQSRGLLVMREGMYVLPGAAWRDYVIEVSSPQKNSFRSETTPIIRSGEVATHDQAHANPGQRIPIDIGIIVALLEEFRELHRQLPSPAAEKDENTGTSDYIFEWQTEGGRSYGCAATFVGGMGPQIAALATERFINRRAPANIVMLGIAAGIDDDVRLGDVVVASHVNQYLDQAKAVPGQGPTFELEAGGDPYRCSDVLVRAAQDLVLAHAVHHLRWQEDGARELRESVTPADFGKLLGNDWARTQPQFVVGPIASGPVVGAAQQFTDWLKIINRKYLTLEMESGGMLAAIASRSDPARSLILRGISDFGDERKKNLDRIGEGAIRRYAMNNAIRLLWKLIEAEVLPNMEFTGPKSTSAR